MFIQKKTNRLYGSHPPTITPDANNIDVAYCAENTTKASIMQANQLTGILLKATFKLKDGNAENASFFTCNDVNQIYTETNMLQALTATLNASAENRLQEGEKLSIKANVPGSETDNATELKNIFEITKEGGEPSYPKNLTDNQAILILNDYSKIKYYKDGITYYYVSLIEHFGDEYCPLPPTGITNVSDYTGGDHLGRWGMLRNNWYELAINSVSGPGEPSIPEIPTDPADKKYSYINCDINILSWAKRTQGVDL